MMKPANLVVFLTDNHNRQFLGAAAHPMVKMPNLDSIAERGVRFTNAYCASPLCCPSRAALATGRYPHQTGYWDNAMVFGPCADLAPPGAGSWP
ncbi:MAG: sulfatase-like hydrolase/transferase [Alphaproteobacteria bacterium]|nr:sulfatase-like hydrolase/transferase [Alphaproteobacteria bacterium]